MVAMEIFIATSLAGDQPASLSSSHKEQSKGLRADSEKILQWRIEYLLFKWPLRSQPHVEKHITEHSQSPCFPLLFTLAQRFFESIVMCSTWTLTFITERVVNRLSVPGIPARIRTMHQRCQDISYTSLMNSFGLTLRRTSGTWLIFVFSSFNFNCFIFLLPIPTTLTVCKVRGGK